MPSFTVVAAEQTKSGTSDKGPWTVWKLGLRDGSDEARVAELFCPDGMSPPAVGSTIEGEIERAQNPSWLDKFKPARKGGGGKAFKADPAKQHAIAMEAAQKVAVDVLRLAMEQGVWKAPEERPLAEMTGVVKMVAQSLYAQIDEVAK